MDPFSNIRANNAVDIRSKLSIKMMLFFFNNLIYLVNHAFSEPVADYLYTCQAVGLPPQRFTLYRTWNSVVDLSAPASDVHPLRMSCLMICSSHYYG